MRHLLSGVVLLVGLIVIPVADAAVHLRSITTSVHPGGQVTLVATSLSSRSVCSIRVHFGAKPPLVAGTLAPHAPIFTVLRWTWKMPTRAPHGKWLVDVSCGTAGSLRTSLVVN